MRVEPVVEAPTSSGEADREPRVEVEAEVVGYRVDDLHFSYETEPDEWFDGTELRILTPAEYAGHKLFVYHQERVAADSPWRDTGHVLRLSVPIRDIDPPSGTSGHLFTSGVRVLP